MSHEENPFGELKDAVRNSNADALTQHFEMTAVHPFDKASVKDFWSRARDLLLKEAGIWLASEAGANARAFSYLFSWRTQSRDAELMVPARYTLKLDVLRLLVDYRAAQVGEYIHAHCMPDEVRNHAHGRQRVTLAILNPMPARIEVTENLPEYAQIENRDFVFFHTSSGDYWQRVR